MNIYNVNDETFMNSSLYKEFMRNNPGRGTLRIRAYAANQAVPVSGVKVIVSTLIDSSKVVFYEGFTNDSGIIDGIILPAPKLDDDNLNVPRMVVYDIDAIYDKNNVKLFYKINMYENVFVVQNINIAFGSVINGG